MNGLSITIDDIPTNNNLWITFNEDDIILYKSKWNTLSEILKSYHEVDIFNGFEKYSQLNSDHFRFLIMAILRKEYSDDMISLLQEFIVMFSLCIEHNTKAIVNHIKITRVSNELLYFDIPLRMDMNFEKPKTYTTKGLKMVVDR